MSADTIHVNPFLRCNATPIDEVRRLSEYWITRDRRLDGRLDERIDIWYARPHRQVQTRCDDFESGSEVFKVTWFSDAEGLHVETWVGFVQSADLRAAGLPVPDDDLMCIHVGKRGSQ